MIRKVFHFFKPRKVFENVLLVRIKYIIKLLFKSYSYGAIKIIGTQYSISILKVPTGKNPIVVKPVQDKDIFAEFLNTYKLEYFFVKDSCKIYIHYSVCERGNSNYVSVQDFVEMIIAKLLTKQSSYQVFVKVFDIETESKIIQKLGYA